MLRSELDGMTKEYIKSLTEAEVDTLQQLSEEEIQEQLM